MENLELSNWDHCSIRFLEVRDLRGAFHGHHSGGGGLIAKLRLTLMTPWTVAHQVPLSMGFPRQEYWTGVGCHVSQISQSLLKAHKLKVKYHLGQRWLASGQKFTDPSESYFRNAIKHVAFGLHRAGFKSYLPHLIVVQSLSRVRFFVTPWIAA